MAIAPPWRASMTESPAAFDLLTGRSAPIHAAVVISPRAQGGEDLVQRQMLRFLQKRLATPIMLSSVN